MRTETILARAEFDEKLPHYWFLATLLTLLVTFIGIPVIPLWLIFGRRVHRKQFEVLECELTERTLNIRRGFLFRVEKNIPLDKITDVAMKEGPILRYLGLSALTVETAGQSGPQGSTDATLTGVVGAPDFRDAILNQRDLVAGVAGHVAPAAAEPTARDADPVLADIRDSVRRIEALLEERRGGTAG